MSISIKEWEDNWNRIFGQDNKSVSGDCSVVLVLNSKESGNKDTIESKESNRNKEARVS
jgi:hypothetical protein